MKILTGISAFLSWLEDLAAHISGPALTAGLGIALIDLLTDGKLLASVPALLFGWAIAQAVGVDGQLVGASAKFGRAWRAGRYWVVAAYAGLMLALGYVAYIASYVFAMQETYGITTTAALSRLGMDTQSWLWQRCALSVFLVMLSGVLRHEKRQEATHETDAQRAERQARELAEAEHKNRMRAVTWGGLARAGRTAVASAIHDTTAAQSADNEHANPAQEEEGTDGQSADDGEPEPRPWRARERGRSAAPAGMMSAPELRHYLAESGVIISDEEARKIVRNAAGFKKVGTTYYADRRALNAAAKRRINEAHPTIQLVG